MVLKGPSRGTIRVKVHGPERRPTSSVLAFLLQDPDVPAQAGADFGGTTQVHPLGAAALAMTAALALVVPRRWVALPLVLLLCFIPAGQRVVVATIDFQFVRVLMMVVWLRVLVRRELRPIVWNHLDRAMVLWGFVSVVTGFLLGWTLTILINRIGTAIDGLMVYLFFRNLIRNHDDLIRIAQFFLASSVAVALFFVFEKQTARNIFGVLGGVPEYTDVRGGRLRCQGAFAHAILAGCFWGALLPFYTLHGWRGRGWRLPALGAVTSVLIVAMCASSTPVMAIVFGVGAAGLWFVRGATRWLRWLGVSWLCVLHFALMKQPVWHLLSRVDLVGGSTGWHRFYLFDQFVNRIDEWGAVGVLGTGHWGPGMHDVTNQFVAEGVAGGLARFLVFVWIVWLGFAGVSRSLRLPEAGRFYQLASWALGTALFMHCMNFIAVTYFEQIVVLWQMTLAAIGSLTLVPGASSVRQLAHLNGD